ncbi:hypothetical protein TUM3794_09240 [Shewanella colwelliana]|uniref:Uncharacterized protein n=1 Tax=Shewanella colwelliana TaxID=23 RepID=A0ABQ4NWB5_SHECO|nr:hypothetical protein [Shewanella colwelliana]GIU37823.1 hypothetical protein TUM3794_09240 [Shewanella colwelliana]
MRHFLRALKWISLTLVAIPLTFYIILVLVNLHDQPPSERVQRNLAQIAESERTLAQHLNNNGYIFSLGFNVVKDISPMEEGLKHLEQLQSLSPMERGNTVTAVGVELLQFPLSDCLKQEDFLLACEAQLAQNDNLETLLADNLWLIERYQQLLSTGNWHDRTPYNVYAYHIPFRKILIAQKLYLLNIYHQGDKLQADQILQLLNTDMLFWQTVSSNTYQLITKMSSASAIESTMQLGELIVSKAAIRLNDPMTELPKSWQHPQSAAVTSFDNAKLGEWNYANGIYGALLNDESGKPLSVTEQVLTWLISPLVKPQDMANRYALMIQNQANMDHCQAGLSLDTVAFFTYNPLGKMMLCSGIQSLAPYQQRIEKLEALRLSLLGRLEGKMAVPPEVIATK